MKFGHLELPVADPERSLAFYRDVLGFQLIDNQGGRFIWVEHGGLLVLLRPGQPGGESDVVYYADDLDREAAELTSRGLATERRGACVHFTDPDGHRFQLVDASADHSEG